MTASSQHCAFSGSKIVWDAAYRRSRPGTLEDRLKECPPPYLGPLDAAPLEEQRRMFSIQAAQRAELTGKESRRDAGTGDLVAPRAKRGYLTVGGHPRRPEKYPTCLNLGLVHNLMNLESEIKLALLLDRVLIPFPLTEAARFTGRPPKQLKFSEIVNLTGLPVVEDMPWPAPEASEFVTISMDPLSLDAAKKSQAPYLNLVRSPKERASMSCVEYSWTAHLPSVLLSWSNSVLGSADRVLRNPPFFQGGTRVEYDAVHIRAGDKLHATDPQVGLPNLSAEEVASRLRGQLRGGRRVRAPALVVVATDSPALISPSLRQNFDLFSLPSNSSATCLTTGCSSFADLAIEMVLMERSKRLVISEHSNIGRRVVLY